MNEPRRRRRTSMDGGAEAAGDITNDDEHHDISHADNLPIYPTIDDDHHSLPPPPPPHPPAQSHLEIRAPLQHAQHALLPSAGLPPRKVIQLLQCGLCSRPLQSPMTFPCGNSLCRACVPATFQRRHISYPDIPGRRECLRCPFLDCGKEHAIADCCMDFTLRKAMDAVKEEMEAETTDPRSRLVRTYRAAKAGLLPSDEYSADIDTDFDDGSNVDAEVLASIMAAASNEMDCQVCYQLLLDPITPPCGHTFCRHCLLQSLSHSPLCPTCRQTLQLPSTLSSALPNKRITDLLTHLCPDKLAERAAVLAADNAATQDDNYNNLTTPVFVCTCSFPSMPTPLFIFEPRYRLMIRRAWESDRKFGMVLPNRAGEPQGALGPTPFMQYGTLLHIEAIHVYPDGESHIWTTGVSKFRIKNWGYRDEYIVADTERLDDLPIADEEALEAAQTSTPVSSISPSPQQQPSWTRLPTAALLRAALAFVERMRATSAPWLTQENLLAFGQPPGDAATFPYWLASVLPVADEERYRLIACQSVRERLVVVVGWIRRIESQRWFVNVPSFVSSVYSASETASTTSGTGSVAAVGVTSSTSASSSAAGFGGSAVIC